MVSLVPGADFLVAIRSSEERGPRSEQAQSSEHRPFEARGKPFEAQGKQAACATGRF
jgi:hypothetical protein